MTGVGEPSKLLSTKACLRGAGRRGSPIGVVVERVSAATVVVVGTLRLTGVSSAAATVTVVAGVLSVAGRGGGGGTGTGNRSGEITACWDAVRVEAEVSMEATVGAGEVVAVR